MTIGWIKLHRLLLDKEIFQDAHVLKVFIYLLLKASYKEMNLKVGNKSIELMPGQLLYGRRVVSQKLNMGEGKLRNIMKYLIANGSIEVESHSKYSIVTIANWEQYQRGESAPDFPFDVDFFGDDEDDELPADDFVKADKSGCATATSMEQSRNGVKYASADGNATEQKPQRTFDPYEISWDGYKDWREESYGEEFWNKVWGKETVKSEAELKAERKSEPAENQPDWLAELGFPDFDDVYPAISEPQYNNINKYKNNNKIQENKTRENNKKTKENKNITNITNTENTENISYRQSESVINDYSNVKRVAGQSTSQEMLLSAGDDISKGKVSAVDSANVCDVDSQAEALTALSAMDDAALDAYFASCSFADFGRDAFTANVDTVSVNTAQDMDYARPYEPDFEPIPLDDSDMPYILDDCRRPGHDFTAEMVYSLTQQDIEQLDAMFRTQSVAAVGYPPYKNQTEKSRAYKSRLSKNNADKKQDRLMGSINSCPA